MEHFVKINSQGGIITALMMENITHAAIESEIDHVYLGSRQDLWLRSQSLEKIQKASYLLSENNIPNELNQDIYPTIVTSYPAEGIFTFDGWITEGNYRSILDLFDFKPKLKINLVDHGQCLTPYFTGHLNFITSTTPNYWYLYVRMPKELELFLWPKLIYSTSIPILAKKIDHLVKVDRIRDRQKLLNEVESSLSYLSLDIKQDLVLPRYQFPYYEGFNRIESDYWLGIYRRNDAYNSRFLFEMAQLCQKTQVPLLCLTPFKSILIKRISRNDRIWWEKLLGKFGINVRHAALELNWMVEDHLEEAEKLKNDIVNTLNKEDIRTYGLVFGVKFTSSYKSPASVLITKEENGLFSLSHTEGFNPNSQKIFSFRDNLLAKELPAAIIQLCSHYYKQFSSVQTDTYGHEKADAKVLQDNMTLHEVYQCQNCFTVLDHEVKVSESAICPVCESSKDVFRLVDFTKMGHT